MLNNKNSISYTGGLKRCNLCLEEKLSILKEKSKYLLKKNPTQSPIVRISLC